MRTRKIGLIMFMLAASLAAACGRSDADVQKAVQDKLAAENITGVTVSVKDGVASLSGEVADVTVKARAETAAKSVEGVKSVNNGLSMKPLPVATPAASDKALKGIIEENWRKAGCTGATVEVKDGIATLSGAVPDDKFAQCVMIANEVKPKSVQNNLTRGGK